LTLFDIQATAFLFQIKLLVEMVFIKTQQIDTDIYKAFSECILI